MAMMEEAQRQIKELENARLGGRVIGLRELTGKSLNRIDVDLMLKKQPKTFNLYLLALEHLQDEHPVYQDYLASSHTGFPVPDPEDPEYPKKQLYGSIETLHNRYHGICGGEGHMSRVPVAAFDPIFWLHHCNIDRLIAKRQAIDPTVWFPTDEDHLNKKGITASITDDLFPFRLPAVSGDKKYCDLNLVRHIADFGYTYSELQEYKDPQALLEAMHDKYQWSL
ncbi:hypothetical protein MMC08_009016 [Hypocenomyce scalaris]|nr:hypothetical protein [Hypocenomyce scalaris]